MQEKIRRFFPDVSSLGVHRTGNGDSFAYRIRVYAPNAAAVRLVGESFGWELGRPMSAAEDGVWETSYTTKTPLDGQAYKFRIEARQSVYYRPDPFAHQTEQTGGRASLFGDPPAAFGDSLWRRSEAADSRHLPCHIYELDDTLLEKEELADLATHRLPHIKSLGVTHLLLPAFSSAYPDFSPWSAETLSSLVSLCHRNGVGLLLTLTPSLPDALRAYDGSPLFEEGDRLALSSPFVLAYLQRIAKTLVSRYRVDGFSLALEEGTANLTEALREAFPNLLLLTDRDCDGATAVWDKKRQTDLDDFFACDPYFRRYLQDALQLPEENRILPENRGEGESRMSRFFGDYQAKFANNRLYSVFAAFTGRRLYSFCANELAPFDKKSRPQWFMLDFEAHRQFLCLRKALGQIYLDTPALWESPITVLFERGEDNLLALKKGRTVALFNFSAVPKELPLTGAESFTTLLHTDDIRYGGSTKGGLPAISQGESHTLFRLPPLSAVILTR